MLVPPLGTHYSKQWSEEDARLLAMFEEIPTAASLDRQNVEYVEMDGTVFEGDIQLGKLSQRLLAALCRESLVPDIKHNLADDDDTFPAVAPLLRTKADLNTLEDRIRKELCFIGLLEDEETMEVDPVLHDDDDEITLELKRVQEELAQQIAINQARKDVLYRLAEAYMAWQEYNALLDEINKAIEQAYIKRYV